MVPQRRVPERRVPERRDRKPGIAGSLPVPLPEGRPDADRRPRSHHLMLDLGLPTSHEGLAMLIYWRDASL